MAHYKNVFLIKCNPKSISFYNPFNNHEVTTLHEANIIWDLSKLYIKENNLQYNHQTSAKIIIFQYSQ